MSNIPAMKLMGFITWTRSPLLWDSAVPYAGLLLLYIVLGTASSFCEASVRGFDLDNRLVGSAVVYNSAVGVAVIFLSAPLRRYPLAVTLFLCCLLSATPGTLKLLAMAGEATYKIVLVLTWIIQGLIVATASIWASDRLLGSRRVARPGGPTQ